MARERSLTNAIAKAKRDILTKGYSASENLLNVCYEYSLRKEDEIPVLVEAYNKWAVKNYQETVELWRVLKGLGYEY